MTWPRAQTYWRVVGIFGLVEVVSWLAYIGPRSEQIITGLMVLLFLFMAWKRPIWLVYASIGELVVGSKGYLFFLHFGHQEISIRMIVFSLVVLAALPHIVRQWRSLRQTVLSISFLFFVGWLAVSVLIAVFRHTSLFAIYADANAFLFLALLPAWWIVVRRDRQWRQHILAIVLAGATIIGLKSWLIVLLFGQDLSTIRHVYEWIRNTGVGEITYINANVYRVFFQSQIYSLLTLCLTLTMFIRQRPPRWWVIPMAMSALGVYISLSRSFWLGLTVGVIVLIGWLVKDRAWMMIRRLWVVLPLGIFAWAMLVWALSFPAFNLAGGRANTVLARLHGSGSADAAASRSNQIQPLLQAISRHPVIGSGFGTSVTYLSTDPRTKGLRTTDAFELGYLDVWLKLGMVGLVLYAVWVLGLWRRISRTAWSEMFLISGMAVSIVHLTTPYLNHPLGLGWLMLTSLYVYDPG